MKIATSQFLRKAWEYIDAPEKWIKGVRHTSPRWYIEPAASGHCSMGALDCALWDLRHSHEATEVPRDVVARSTLALGELAAELYGDRLTRSKEDLTVGMYGPRKRLIAFNDSPETEHAELAELWEKKALEFEEAGD